MGQLVFGIRIFTRTAVTDAVIGASSGIIQLIQSDVTSPSSSGWKSGIIAMDGIGEWDRSAEVFDGGNVASPGGFSFTLSNISNLSTTLAGYGINLDNCIVELYEWNDTAITKRGMFRCKKPNISNYEISVDCVGLSLGRVVQTLKQIDTTDYPNASPDMVGKYLPAVYGALYPAFDASGNMTRRSLAKFVRTVDSYQDSLYENAYFDFNNVSYPGIFDYPIETIFSVGTKYSCRLPGAIGKATLPDPVDVYAVVTDGTGTGQIRLITAWEAVNDIDGLMVWFDIKDAFLTELSETNDDTRSWIRFVKIGRNYNADFWPCKDFLDSTGQSVSTAELYSYNTSDEKAYRIADFGFQVKDTNNNSLDIDGSQYTENIDTVDSFLTLPITDLSLEDSADLSQWNCNGIDFDSFKFDPYMTAARVKFLFNGLYGYTDTIYPNTTVTNGTLTDQDHSCDKDNTSYAQFSPSISVSSMGNVTYQYLKVLKFSMPALPENVSIDKIYLGIKLYSKSGLSFVPQGVSSPFFAIFRRFAYTKSTGMILDDKSIAVAEKSADGFTADDIPDRYYTTSPETGNLNFYKNSVPSGSDYESLNGYTFFEIAADAGKYKSIVEGGLFFARSSYPATLSTPFTITDETKIFELAIIVKLATSDIKSSVFSPLSGRIFNDTWGGRVSASANISSVRHLLENACRLQNFSESCSVPAAGWGMNYASSPLIDTSTFDALTSFDSFSPASQIEEEAEGFTDKIKMRLCRTFGLVSFINKDGEESVFELLAEPGTITNTVTIGDVLDRKKISVTPWPIDKSFPELTINYQKNNLNGELNSTIRIMHAEASSFTSAYVTGVSDASTAEAIWESGHELYVKTEKPSVGKLPSSLTDVAWANGAGADDIAIKNIQVMQALMKCDILELDFSYMFCTEWELGEWFYFTGAKHTSGVARKCQIISIKPNPKYPQSIHIKAIMKSV